MTTFDIVKKLADEQQITMVELEEKLGFSRNSLYAWKKSKPSVDKLQKVADYFKVSTDYLLGRTNDKRRYELTDKNIQDIGEEVDRMLSGLETSAEVNYYGEPMTDEDRQKMRVAMTAALEAAQIEAKKRFTPNKYKK